MMAAISRGAGGQADESRQPGSACVGNRRETFLWPELPRKAGPAGAQHVDGQEGATGTLRAQESQEKTQDGWRGSHGAREEGEAWSRWGEVQQWAGPPYPGRKSL